LHKITSCSH